MKWLTRPWFMASASAVLAAGAAALILLSSPSAQSRPVPSPTAEGDREIAWLYTATSTSSWSQFVVALRRAAARLEADHPGVRAEIGDAAFPKQTTGTPEVALSLPGKAGRLVFRWYKLTSDWKTRNWVEALLKGRRPPLAVIGGSSSYSARELAWQLSQQTGGLPDQDRPMLLMTTATADRVVDPRDPTNERGVELTRLYPDRTFRFCFSNSQMAAAVMHFLDTQPDLRPNPDSIHMVEWVDDSYSRDLTDGFRAALPSAAGPTNPERIDSSVGSFLTPNLFEFGVAERVVQDLERQGDDEPLAANRAGVDWALRDLEGGGAGRPLLVVTGQLGPSRRFLRQIANTSPEAARRFVVATGDVVSFDTVYRDRRLTWPIQDLPFPLVCFRHFDPIYNAPDDAEIGFREEGQAPPEEQGFKRSDSGTEEVLQDSAIIEALVRAFDRDEGPAADAAELGRRLSENHLFGEDGNRRGGVDENIVCLRPRFKGDRILPESTIEVWASREGVAGGPPRWERRGKKPLTVSYEPPLGEERAGP